MASDACLPTQIETPIVGWPTLVKNLAPRACLVQLLVGDEQLRRKTAGGCLRDKQLVTSIDNASGSEPMNELLFDCGAGLEQALWVPWAQVAPGSSYYF